MHGNFLIYKQNILTTNGGQICLLVVLPLLPALSHLGIGFIVFYFEMENAVKCSQVPSRMCYLLKTWGPPVVWACIAGGLWLGFLSVLMGFFYLWSEVDSFNARRVTWSLAPQPQENAMSYCGPRQPCDLFLWLKSLRWWWKHMLDAQLFFILWIIWPILVPMKRCS